jgi:hypothetical protein
MHLRGCAGVCLYEPTVLIFIFDLLCSRPHDLDTLAASHRASTIPDNLRLLARGVELQSFQHCTNTHFPLPAPRHTCTNSRYPKQLESFVLRRNTSLAHCWLGLTYLYMVSHNLFVYYFFSFLKHMMSPMPDDEP